MRGLLALLAFALLAASPPALAQAKPGELDLAQYRGKVVYLDFWASWCGPCQESFPYMEQLVKRLPADNFVIVAVNVDHERAKADAFLKHFHGTVPVIFDPDGKIASQFAVKGMPTSMLVGRDGRTRYVHKGFFPEKTSDYDAHISELLHEK